MTTTRRIYSGISIPSEEAAQMLRLREATNYAYNGRNADPGTGWGGTQPTGATGTLQQNPTTGGPLSTAPSFRRTVIGNPGTAGGTYTITHGSAAVTPLEPGVEYFWQGWVRCSKPGAITGAFGFYGSDGYLGLASPVPAKTVEANVWTPLNAIVATPPAGSVRSQFQVSFPVLALGLASGDTLDVSAHMLCKTSELGELRPQFRDGDSLGWQWAGVPYASQARGPIGIG